MINFLWLFNSEQKNKILSLKSSLNLCIADQLIDVDNYEVNSLCGKKSIFSCQKDDLLRKAFIY